MCFLFEISVSRIDKSGNFGYNKIESYFSRSEGDLWDI